MAMIPQYNTKLFSDIYSTAKEFLLDWQECGLYTSELTDENVNILYYLLYAKYANNPIANLDEEQFKYKMWSIMFKEGGSWQKRLSMQKSLRSLTDDEIKAGSKAIYNHAYNPSSDPSTSSLSELSYINEQNTTNYKKSVMDAYQQLWDLLDTDVTSEFINKFKVCFKQFVVAENPLLYTTEVDD